MGEVLVQVANSQTYNMTVTIRTMTKQDCVSIDSRPFTRERCAWEWEFPLSARIKRNFITHAQSSIKHESEAQRFVIF